MSMEKKDMFEVLAKTYFDHSKVEKTGSKEGTSKEGKVSKTSEDFSPKKIKYHLILFNILIFGIILFGIRYYFLPSKTGGNGSVISNQRLHPITFAFDFSKPGNEVVYDVDLDSEDLSQAKNMVFKIRFDSGTNHAVIVRVENGFRERAEIPITGLNSDWAEVVIPLDEVYGISSWRDIRKVSFVLYKWNLASEKGAVFIDEMRFES